MALVKKLCGLCRAGGMYYWCYRLMGKKYGRFASWVAGEPWAAGLIGMIMVVATILKDSDSIRECSLFTLKPQVDKAISAKAGWCAA